MTTLFRDHKLDLSLVFAGIAGCAAVITGNAPMPSNTLLGLVSTVAIVPVGVLSVFTGMEGITSDPHLDI